MEEKLVIKIIADNSIYNRFEIIDSFYIMKC